MPLRQINLEELPNLPDIIHDVEASSNPSIR